MANYCSICSQKVTFLTPKVSFIDGIICKNCFLKTGLTCSYSDILWARSKTIENFKELLKTGKKIDTKSEIKAKKAAANARHKEAKEFVHNLPDNTKNNSSNEPKPVQQIVVQKTEKKKYNRHAPKCPKCKSHNVQVIDNKRKAFSLGKAAIGGALYGVGGTIAGFAGKRGKKYEAVCMDCGRKFTIKL